MHFILLSEEHSEDLYITLPVLPVRVIKLESRLQILAKLLRHQGRTSF